MKALDRLLSGRDERARIQGNLLRRYGTVVQVSLNIPGLPKTLSGDRTLVSLASCLLLKEAASSGILCCYKLFPGQRGRLFRDNGDRERRPLTPERGRDTDREQAMGRGPRYRCNDRPRDHPQKGSVRHGKKMPALR